jgi:hypothetical protein
MVEKRNPCCVLVKKPEKALGTPTRRWDNNIDSKETGR